MMMFSPSLAADAALPVVLKATVLLAAAALAARVLRRAGAPAAVRHLAWTLAVAALLVLPVLAALLPGWRVPLVGLPILVEARALSPAPSSPESPVQVYETGGAGQVMPVGGAEPASLPALSGDGISGDGMTGDPVDPAGAVRRLPPLAWGEMLAALYLLGAAFLLGRLMLGAWRVRRLARAAAVMDGAEWTALARELGTRLGVARPVTLLRGGFACMPMTWGTLRPVVLLPADADAWPDEVRRVVLLHELAHVARRDCLTQTLAGVACALYWFHPGTWYAARRLRVERELACDDRVLAAGTRPNRYARHLLDIAAAFQLVPSGAAHAVSMARPSQLEGRLLAVLDSARPRGTASPRAALGGIALSLLLVLPLAALRPATVDAADSSRPESTESSEPALASFAVAGETGQTAEGRRGELVERRFRVAPGSRLVMDLALGGGVRVTGWDRDEVYVRAWLDARDWRLGHVRIARTGDSVHVDSRDESADRPDENVPHEYEVFVPRRMDLEIASGGGTVEVEGVEGRIFGRSRGGAASFRALAGSIDFLTAGGAISVADSRLTGQVRTGGGAVTIRNTTGGVRGFSGSNEVRYLSGDDDAQAGDPVRISTAEGREVRLERAPDGLDVVTGGGIVHVKSVGRFARVVTGGGWVRLDAVDGPVKASTGGGDVTVVMTGDPDRGPRDVDISTGAGDVTLVLPAGIDAEFDVATAYTTPDNGGRRGRIVSDWPLRASESPNWETDGRMTPRRFVRGAGRAGDGRNLIRIRTVNGNVTIRRAGSGGRGSPAFDSDVALRTSTPAAVAVSQQSVDDPRSELIPGVPRVAVPTAASLRGAPDSAAILRFTEFARHQKQHEADLVRERAEWALAQVRDGRVVEPLIAALGNADWRVRAYATWGLTVAKDARATPALLPLLRDGNWRVRAAAAGALNAAGDPRALEPMIAALSDAAWQVRVEAAEYLARRPEPRARQALAAALRDPHIAVRGIAEAARGT